MSRNDLEEMQSRMAEMERRLRRHDDVAAIRDVLGRYSRALDRNDMSLLETVFHDDAEVDYGFFRGSSREAQPIIMGATRSRDRTWHCTVQTEYNFTDDHCADVDSYCLAIGFDPAPEDGNVPSTSTFFQGHYFDRFVLRNGRWAIRHRTFRVLGAIGMTEIALEGDLATLNRMPSMLEVRP